MIKKVFVRTWTETAAVLIRISIERTTIAIYKTTLKIIIKFYKYENNTILTSIIHFFIFDKKTIIKFQSLIIMNIKTKQTKHTISALIRAIIVHCTSMRTATLLEKTIIFFVN